MTESAFEPMTRTFAHSLNETMLVNPILEFLGVRQLFHGGYELLIMLSGAGSCGAPQAQEGRRSMRSSYFLAGSRMPNTLPKSSNICSAIPRLRPNSSTREVTASVAPAVAAPNTI